MSKNLFSLFVFIAVTANVFGDVPIVQIPNGKIQGTLERSYGGREYASFQGIPFAKPPIGDLRFQPPQKPNDWPGIWVANTQIECIQKLDVELIGTEDCLYLNVYVPRLQPNSSDNLNVIVHIHGGAFMFFSPHYYSGPKHLMDEDVVFVTIAYRLGSFGFLSTGDDVVPGNNGMKDQVFALRWIKDNIKHFGGNPDSITITGMSAGGASVHFHYFSPLSKGLFHRGLSQSGVALNPWAIQSQSALNKRTKALAEKVGCYEPTNRDLVNCLRSRSAQQLTEATQQLYEVDGFPIGNFGPVIEARGGKDAYLTEHPYKMLQEGNVLDLPLIFGITKEEGDFVANALSKNPLRLARDFDQYALSILEAGPRVPKEVVQRIKKQYFGDMQNLSGLIRLIGDRDFAFGLAESAILQAQINKSPTYFYRFVYRGEKSFAENFLENANHVDTSHGDDVFYYLSTRVSPEKMTEKDEKMKRVFLKWLTSYADNKGPQFDDVIWEPLSKGGELWGLYFEDPDQISMEEFGDLGSRKFWKEIDLDGYRFGVETFKREEL